MSTNGWSVGIFKEIVVVNCGDVFSFERRSKRGSCKSKLNLSLQCGWTLEKSLSEKDLYGCRADKEGTNDIPGNNEDEDEDELSSFSLIFNNLLFSTTISFSSSLRLLFFS
jgi:hypothetical protein